MSFFVVVRAVVGGFFSDFFVRSLTTRATTTATSDAIDVHSVARIRIVLSTGVTTRPGVGTRRDRATRTTILLNEYCSFRVLPLVAGLRTCRTAGVDVPRRHGAAPTDRTHRRARVRRGPRRTTPRTGPARVRMLAFRRRRRSDSGALRSVRNHARQERKPSTKYRRQSDAPGTHRDIDRPPVLQWTPPRRDPQSSRKSD